MTVTIRSVVNVAATSVAVTGWIALAALLSNGCAISPAPSSPPVSNAITQQTPLISKVPAGGTSVPMPASYTNTPVVYGKMNGATVPMLLDTGSFANMVSAPLAKRQGWKNNSTALKGADVAGNKLPDLGAVRLDDVDLGAANFKFVDAIVADLSRFQVFGRGPEAVLGIPMFQDVLLTLDYPNSRVKIERGSLPEPNGSDIFPIIIGESGHVMVEITLGDRTIWAVVDSGYSNGLVIPSWLQHSLPGADRTISGAMFRFYQGAGRAQTARLDADLRIGRYLIKRPLVDVSIGELPILGNAYLSAFAVTIDQRAKRIRFTRSGPPVLPMPPLTGCGFRIDTRARKVTEVIPGGWADLAGMKVGDTVLRVEGKEFADFLRDPPEEPLLPGYLGIEVKHTDGTTSKLNIRLVELLP